MRLSWQERLYAPWYGEVNIAAGAFLLLIWIPAQVFIGLNLLADDPVSYVIASNRTYYAWMNVAHFLALPMTVVLLISGRRLCRGTAGGALLSVTYAVYGLAAGVAHILVTYFCLYRPLTAEPPIWPQALGAARGMEIPLLIIALRMAWVIYLGLLLRRVLRFRIKSGGGVVMGRLPSPE